MSVYRFIPVAHILSTIRIGLLRKISFSLIDVGDIVVEFCMGE
jgi:hypothetical protein